MSLHSDPNLDSMSQVCSSNLHAGPCLLNLPFAASYFILADVVFREVITAATLWKMSCACFFVYQLNLRVID